MIVRSLEASGFGCFAEPTGVQEFAPGLNILASPNGTGKSTLFTAFVRALTDNHRTRGADAEQMRPWGRSLTPEVRVEFEHAGKRYRLAKRFLDRPAARIERFEQSRFVAFTEGDSADEFLRELLRSTRPGRGLSQVDNWGLGQVLWTPQGRLALGALTGEALNDLQGSIAAQFAGPEALRIEAAIHMAYSQVFTPTGRDKKGTRAAELAEDVAALQSRVTGLRSALDAFEQCSIRIEETRKARAGAERDMTGLAAETAAARAAAEDFQRLTSERKVRLGRKQAAEASYRRVQEQIDTLRSLRGEIAKAEREINTINHSLPAAGQAVETAGQAQAAAESKVAAAANLTQVAHQAGARASAAWKLLEASRQLRDVEATIADIRRLDTTIAELRKERAAILAPTAEELRLGREAANTRDKASIQIEASMLRVEIEAEQPFLVQVLAGEQPGEYALRPGSTARFMGSPAIDLRIPAVGRFRVSGPAAEGLAEARTASAKAESTLVQMEARFGTRVIEALETLAARATEREREVREQEIQRDTLLGSRQPADLTRQALEHACAVHELLTAYPEWEQAAPDAKLLEQEAEQMRRTAAVESAAAEAQRAAASEALSAAGRHHNGLLGRLQEEQARRSSSQTQIDRMSPDGKTDEQRDQEYRTALLEFEACRIALEEIELQLAAYPADPVLKLAGLETRKSALDVRIRELDRNEAAESERLRALADQSPYSELANAEEKLAELDAELSSERLRCASIAMLQKTYSAVKEEMLAAVTKPVAEVATGILDRITGAPLGMVRLGSNFGIDGIERTDVEGPIEIVRLSGGEREQVYLATRLALAKVAAADERQLLVLDDVLTATDDVRMRRICDVLEECAERLQIVILTCHPERFSGLAGARLPEMQRAAAAAV